MDTKIERWIERYPEGKKERLIQREREINKEKQIRLDKIKYDTIPFHSKRFKKGRDGKNR